MDSKTPATCTTSAWRKTLQTFWPLLVMAITFGVWAVQIQTVSNEEFTTLSTRVTVVEERLPSKAVMRKLQENQAVMRSQLDHITKHIDKIPHG